MRTVKLDLALVLVTVLWGAGFVAQRLGLEHLGPFSFNACRFALGGGLVWLFLCCVPRLCLPPLLVKPLSYQARVWQGVSLGLLLFCGAAFQQWGLVTTSAGKAGFLTILYIVFVPCISLFRRQKVFRSEILGAFMALLGSYYLSVNERFEIGWGDILVVFGAVAWAFHAIAVSHATRFVAPLVLAYQQFFVCGALSLIVALFFEELSVASIVEARYALFYAGGFSIAIGYTLQVVVQREVSPTHAVIIFSLEGFFAALAGWLFLDEVFTWRALMGVGFLMLGVFVAQYRQFSPEKPIGVD